MRFPFFEMPDGWPWSLWFLVATAILFLLQRFPLTGIFLMFMLAMFWSVVLVNLGFIGIGVEALLGRVSRAWLILPALYFGGYYAVYAMEQATLAALRLRYAQENAGKTLPFDQALQDLVIVSGKGDFHPSPFELVRRFGVKRVFAGNGRVHFMGNSDACALLRGNDIFRSAGVYAFGFHTDGELGSRRLVKGFCSIYAPAQPDRPVVRVHSDEVTHSRLLLPVRTQELKIRNEATGQAVEVRAGTAAPLKPFPMPVMGCGLNSGAPSWDCSAGFMRNRVSILEPGKGWADGAGLIAQVLGLAKTQDFAAVATGPETLQEIGDEADRQLVAKELAILERMLADPLTHVRDGWFYHLPNRGEAVAPHADRIFAALGALQRSDLGGSENGRNLWRVAAALPDEALEPHRPQMVEWLRPENARAWSQSDNDIYIRLDVSDPVQREIVLHRLEAEKGDLKISLLPSFCRMGAAAPDDVKQRLLALWKARAVDRSGKPKDRSDGDAMLYLTLARMGLKEAAGKVEQRYYGPTFAGIWEEVTPETPEDICSASLNDIRNRYRRR